MGEFELIARYFDRPVQRAVLGVGDDCALLQTHANTRLAVSTDMLVLGRHFFADVCPFKLGHKALAVNLSDLAACGARPLAFTLALSMPAADEAWLEQFSRGLLALADAHGCELIGGDTTCGPLTICITIFGEIPVLAGRSLALLRSGAVDGDDLYVSGQLGDARLALDALRGQVTLPAGVLEKARARLEMPTPRVALGLALRGIASAAIDISDGLLGDLGHILSSSNVGATVYVDVATSLIAARAEAMELSDGQWRALALSGGDDYELLFTAAPSRGQAVSDAAQASHTPVTRIGHIHAQAGLQLIDRNGVPQPHVYQSFDHFASDASER